MARHRSFSSEFKRQISREFLEGRAGMHELARRYSLSRNLIRLWVRKYEAEGIDVNHKAVARVMQKDGLQVRPLRRFVLTTDSRHDNPHGLLGSMGRRGNPYDNSKAESSLLSQKDQNRYASATWSNLATMSCPARGVHFNPGSVLHRR